MTRNDIVNYLTFSSSSFSNQGDLVLPLRKFRSKHRKSNRSQLRNRSSHSPRVESLEQRKLLAAELLQVTFENLSDDTGLANTPVWIAAHDGAFDIGDLGAAASGFGGLELIAEDGDPSELVNRFANEGVGNDDVIFAPDGFAGAPVFEAGEVVTHDFMVDDTLASPYFSFASMVIPSNDAFIGNLNPLAYRLFDNAGNFLGPQTIVIYGSQIWDSGTVVNDPLGGAAFATAGGTSADEGGVIAQHTGLDDFIGAGLSDRRDSWACLWITDPDRANHDCSSGGSDNAIGFNRSASSVATQRSAITGGRSRSFNRI